MDPLPGQKIAHFRICSKLGQGGMGTVFRAEDETLGRPIALKILPGDAFDDRMRHQRFLREARSAAAVVHPYIAAIYDAGEASGITYIAMEYVEGKTLRTVFTERTAGLLEIVNLGVQICEGLACAHESGVVHRDLKPDNIMIRGDGHPKILDFGLAKLIESRDLKAASTFATGDGPRPHLSVPGEILGTPAYMSPEQARGEAVDVRSDLFSLGVIFYEWVTGKSPFKRPSAVETLSAILRDEPPSPASLRRGCPPPLERVLHKCLAKDPTNRYQTARELLEALRGIREDLELAALRKRSPGVRYLRRAGYTLGAAGVVLILALLVGKGILQRPAESPVGWKNSNPSLAVLYFANMSPAQEDEYLAPGLTEDVITSLSKLKALNVFSRSAVEFYRDQHVDPRRLRSDLGASHVVEGSIRKNGSDVRVTAQLIDTGSGYHVWAETYDCTMETVFSIQDTIVAAVEHALHLRPEQVSIGAVGPRWTRNAAAYAFYLRGREEETRRDTEGPEPAIREWYEKALAVDPEYAPALAGMAVGLVKEWGYHTPREPGGLEPALDMAQRAKALDPTLADAWWAEAAVWVEMNDPVRAVAVLDEALVHLPAAPRLFDLMGYTRFWSLGQREEAVTAYSKSMALNPSSFYPYLNLCDISLAAGKIDEARRIVADGLAHVPEDIHLRAQEAQVLRREKRHQEAISANRTLCSRYPDSFFAIIKLASAYRVAGRLAQAESVYAAAIARWPLSTRALNAAGWDALDRHDYAAADDLFRRAIAIAPRAYWPRKLLARSLTEQRRPREAEAILLEIEKIWPKDAESARALSEFYATETEDFTRAKEWAERAVALAPNWPNAYWCLADVFSRKSDYERAAATYGKALALKRDDPQFHRALSRSLLSLGRFEEAAREGEIAVSLNPTNVQSLTTLGDIYDCWGKYNLAAAAWEKAVALDSTASVLNRLASTYRRAGRYRKAVEAYERSAALDTTWFSPHLGCAILFTYYQRDFAQAREHLGKALRRASTPLSRARVYDLLGAIEALDHRPERSREAYEQARQILAPEIKAHANDPYVLNHAASVAGHLGDTEKTRAYVTRLLEVQGESPEYLYGAGCYLARIGDVEAALTCVEKAVALGYNDRSLMEVDIDLAPIRDHPRFKKLLDSMR